MVAFSFAASVAPTGASKRIRPRASVPAPRVDRRAQEPRRSCVRCASVRAGSAFGIGVERPIWEGGDFVSERDGGPWPGINLRESGKLRRISADAPRLPIPCANHARRGHQPASNTIPGLSDSPRRIVGCRVQRADRPGHEGTYEAQGTRIRLRRLGKGDDARSVGLAGQPHARCRARQSRARRRDRSTIQSIRRERR